MNDSKMVLKYELTLNDFRAATARLQKRSRVEWLRRFIALILVWFALSAGIRADYLRCSVFLLVAAFMAIPRLTMLWWMMNYWLHDQPPVAVRVEVDETGLHLHDTFHKTSNRLWWSRLSGAAEFDGDFELMFDGKSYPQMYIPARAFSDEAQRTRFSQQISSHL